MDTEETDIQAPTDDVGVATELSDFGTQDEDLVRIVEDFLNDIGEAENLYGSEAVQEALESLLPGFNLADLENIGGSEDLMDLHESLGLLTRLKTAAQAAGPIAQKVWGKLKQYFTPAGRKAAAKARADAAKKAAAGTAGTSGPGIGTALLGGEVIDTAGDLATAAAGKNWDQEVDIARISTEDEMYVRNEKLEDLLIKTNDAIEKMTQTMIDTQKVLGVKLDNVDASVDDGIAAQTGETTGQVQSRQGAGGRATPKPPKKEKKKKDKPRAPDEGLPKLET